MIDSEAVDELKIWLEEGYAQSVRTAYLILGDRLDAEDAVQEAFLKAWRFRDTLQKESSFQPWLYRVVVNTCYSRLRREIAQRERRSTDDVGDVDAGDDVERRVSTKSDVMSALKDLPTHLRIVIVLRYYSDLSERDIGVAIGRKPGTVKSRLHEARRRLALNPALHRDEVGDQIANERSGR